jgi:hypothetical protein
MGPASNIHYIVIGLADSVLSNVMGVTAACLNCIGTCGQRGLDFNGEF